MASRRCCPRPGRAGGWRSTCQDTVDHPASSYTFDAQADLVGEALPAGRDLVLLGNSMGGMVALALAASRPGVPRVIGFSIKTWWPAEQVEGMRAQSLKPARIFPTREQAVERYLMAAGLRGVGDPAASEHEAGVVQVEDGWRIAQDMGTFDFGVPDMPALARRGVLPGHAGARVGGHDGAGGELRRPRGRDRDVRGARPQPARRGPRRTGRAPLTSRGCSLW